MQQDSLYFFGFLFFAVFLISQAFLLPAAGNKAKHKTISKRLKESQSLVDEQSRSLLNEHYLRSLSPIDQKLVSFSAFSNMKKSLELAGVGSSLTQVVTITSLSQIVLFIVFFFLGARFYVAFLVSFFVWLVLYFIISSKISQRLAKFEELFPDALDVMKRMLSAGHPITYAFSEVGKEMPDPLGSEFKTTFNLLNYGYDIRLAMMQMVERNPTVSMFAFSSAVLLQKETGGDLSENLDKVSKVLRARFKLQRKIKTLSAESKLSAWILVLAPFAIFVMLSFISPGYLDPLYTDPRGTKLVMIGGVGLFIGAMWIRKIINFEV
ncbi:type II secretion system F family protein [Vibrio diazotrophicus]|uniref:type II secretion system F family protein n=1 Tax=Vibrio diazotrophicus TaxID=685 RepID=UPI00142DAB2C|nr:type II secretion system F family protein [Vibrio diazotrophicus]NIY91352.1 type II secretion system F family protein [Vibrio diazotrophicus]